MNKELQVGRYEFFPYEEKIQRVLDEFSTVNGEPKKSEKGTKEDVEKLLDSVRRLKQIKTHLD